VTRVLVTGAAGQLGQDLVRVLGHAGYDVAATTSVQLDVRDRGACRRVLRNYGPDIVIDCTVPAAGGERGEEAEAPHEELYTRGADNLASGASDVGALSVYPSCADVFDGEAEIDYVESDLPRPVTAHGAAKLEAERAVANRNRRHAIVRSSWLFGAHGRNLVSDLLEAAKTADRIAVDIQVRSSPTYTRHLASALVALVRRPAYGIFHLAAGGGCTQLQLARALFRAAGVRCQAVPAVPEGAAGTVSHLVLGTRRRELPRLPDWRLGLSAYIEERARAARPGPATA
jgi:dTDP-4-dehydrorhamnose reductase